MNLKIVFWVYKFWIDFECWTKYSNLTNFQISNQIRRFFIHDALYWLPTRQAMTIKHREQIVFKIPQLTVFVLLYRTKPCFKKYKKWHIINFILLLKNKVRTLIYNYWNFWIFSNANSFNLQAKSKSNFLISCKLTG